MKNYTVSFLSVTLALSSLTSACAANLADVDWNAIRDVQNEPIATGDLKWRVVCFLGAECPLARLYGSRLQTLSDEFSRDGVRVIGINSNLQDSPADVRGYIHDLGVTFPVIKDTRQSLARAFGATRTPQVFVADAKGRIRYRGRIDDQYEPGIARAKPTQQDLRLAIEALVAGREVTTTQTEAVGCLITMRRQPEQPVDVESVITFARDVAPILNTHCVECHRKGEIGPFALTDYNEVVGWGDMMLEVIQQKRMPPWHADPRHGEFVGERRMPDAALKTLETWVAQGMPRGDLNDLPRQPQWNTGWHLPNPPDVELVMRDQPFIVPAGGTVEYQYFVVDPQWDDDRWVRAAQVIPGDASVVHHAIVFVRPPDGSYTNGIGWMGGYVPGQRLTPLPSGHARLIPARSKLIFQMHYTPNGRKTGDRTKVGVWFSAADDVTHEATTRVALNHDFEIPPGADNFMVYLKLDGFAKESRLLSLTPHMHLRGKSFRLTAQREEQNETLLSVPRYDFNWQHWYQLKTPLPLDQVRALQMQVAFDNSAGNPANPDPHEYVTWGDQTWQEMAVAFFDIAHPRDKPRIVVRHEIEETAEDEAARTRKLNAIVSRFLSQLDQNGDGVVEREETPDAFRRYGFYRFDHNGDDRLQRSEIEAEAARRL